MIQPIMKDIFFLQQKSEVATTADRGIGKDLEDTLNAHSESCVGMAANMIGVNKRIIIVNLGFTNLLLYNPMLVSKTGPYQASESCLSLMGSRSTTRYKEIVVLFYNQEWEKQTMNFKGLVAQIIQHELDHLDGILI